MEKSMQPQVQSEQDKMVPIDTSGEPVEVTVNPEKTEEKKVTQESDVQVEQVQEQTQSTEEPSKESELEDYSQNVQKRIDKLTRKMREAERREQAAIEYAKKVNEKFKNANQSNLSLTETTLADREKALLSQKEFAKRALEAAINAQDVEKQVAAQQEIGRLTIEDERLKVSKAKALQRKTQFENQPEEDINKIIQAETGGKAQVQEQQYDPKAVAWAEKNKWFGMDNAMTYTAYDIHNKLVQEGIDPSQDEYYKQIDLRIRNEFPHKFNEGGEVNKPRSQKVASAVRTSPSGRRTVKLTPSQVAIAKKLGVPLEEYAKHVKEA
jgi:hypothetical protein